MTPLPERTQVIELIQEAFKGGARLERACDEAGISLRTYRRWFKAGEVQNDQRPVALRPAPSNRIPDETRQEILEICNSQAFSHLPPSQIVPSLLDSGIYLASESSYYRILHEHGQVNHRGQSLPPKPGKQPTTHHADGPNQVWCWDITYLPTRVRGQFFYLYMFEDLWSRKIVGYEVHERECGQLSAELIHRCMLREQCLNTPLVLHSDNGAPMRANTMKAKLEQLGVASSHSRPRVSNDNAYIESLFRNLKYRALWPSSGFNSLAEARDWVEEFVGWYNEEHKHSGIRFVSPQERHAGKDAEILAHRQRVLEKARQRHPERWGSRPIRNCEPVGIVSLNPDTEKVEKAAA